MCSQVDDSCIVSNFSFVLITEHQNMNMEPEKEEGRENLFMDLLQEGDLLLQSLDASLQVQTSQSGSIHVLQRFGESVLKLVEIIIIPSSNLSFLRT